MFQETVSTQYWKTGWKNTSYISCYNGKWKRHRWNEIPSFRYTIGISTEVLKYFFPFSLASTFTASQEVVSVEAIKLQIEELFNIQYKGYYGRIKFVNTIMLEKERIKVDHSLNFNTTQLNLRVSFDILNDTIENFNLVNLWTESEM